MNVRVIRNENILMLKMITYYILSCIDNTFDCGFNQILINIIKLGKTTEEPV